MVHEGIINGVINVNKPPGMTSHDVVNIIRRTYNIKRVGHTGTLDPGAAGVLIVCVGKATRISRFIVENDKEYQAGITFGAITDTGDRYGKLLREQDASFLTESDVKAALTFFTGEIMQAPPMVSAIKHQGRKLYELARAGVTVERKARAVTISSLLYLNGANWGKSRPTATLQITCSKGTYVRTLCEDLGNYLGCGAFMSSLLRTRVGSFNIADSFTLEEIKDKNISQVIIPTEEALSAIPAVVVKSGAVRAISSGAKLYMPGVSSMPAGLPEGTTVRLHGPEGLLAIAETGFDEANSHRVVFKPICVLV